MSEFECRCGYIFCSADKGVCPECGGRPFRMDGRSASELRRMERMEQEEDDEGSDET
jgi:hypothetical protein